MKSQINEIKRMQQLAGIINESQLKEADNLLPTLEDESEEKKEQLIDDLAELDVQMYRIEQKMEETNNKEIKKELEREYDLLYKQYTKLQKEYDDKYGW